jgi:uncharacterized protein YbjT (DUF2867 family)
MKKRGGSIMITILGATGHVGGKIAEVLGKKGEKVRLVARSADRLRPFVNKQAQALAGDASDVEFLVKAFKDTDAVFTLVPPNFKAEKFMSHADKVVGSIASALEISRVNYVVNLSSVGAELPEGTGPIVGLNHMEERLNRVKGLNVLHLRAAFFMENLMSNIDLIRSKGVNGGAGRGDLKIPMIATKDIAEYAAERLLKKDFTGFSVRYLLGQRDLSMIEATEIIGRKINKPDLAYVMFPYDEAEKGMIAAGFSPDMSRLYIEMSRAFNEGRIRAEKRTTASTTPTAFETFCDEVFVPAYSQRKAA